LVQVVPTQAIAQAILRGLDEALAPYRQTPGVYRFRLDEPEDKAAFHRACKEQLDRYVGAGWRWRHFQMATQTGLRKAERRG
jgi:hypothetical protein